MPIFSGALPAGWAKATNGAPTQAGGIVAEWQKVIAYRATLFDGIGATGPTIFAVQVLGISDFVKTRRTTVANQLKAESLSDSGVDFTSNQWSLTRSTVPSTAKLVRA